MFYSISCRIFCILGGASVFVLGDFPLPCHQGKGQDCHGNITDHSFTFNASFSEPLLPIVSTCTAFSADCLLSSTVPLKIHYVSLFFEFWFELFPFDFFICVSFENECLMRDIIIHFDLYLSLTDCSTHL